MTTKAEFDAYANGALVIIGRLEEVPVRAVLELLNAILAMVPDVIVSEVAAATPAPAEVQITGSDAQMPVVIPAPASEAPVVQGAPEVVEPVAEQPADPAPVEEASVPAVEEVPVFDAPVAEEQPVDAAAV